MKNGRIQHQTAKMENKTTNRAKMSNKQCIKIKIAVLTAQVIKQVKRHYEPPVLILYLGGFPGLIA